MLSKIIGDTIVKCWSRKPSSITDVHPTDGIYILYAITFVVYRLSMKLMKTVMIWSISLFVYAYIHSSDLCSLRTIVLFQ